MSSVRLSVTTKMNLFHVSAFAAPSVKNQVNTLDPLDGMLRVPRAEGSGFHISMVASCAARQVRPVKVATDAQHREWGGRDMWFRYSLYEYDDTISPTESRQKPAAGRPRSPEHAAPATSV